MTDTRLGEVLSSAPPQLSDTEAADIARLHFGVAGAIKRLTSERDLNLRITTPGQAYVLKLANPAEPVEVTDFQTKALLHLETSGLPVPKVMRSVTGRTEAQIAQGTLRLLTYLEGTPQHMTPRTPAQAANMARMAARLTQGLAGFSHPAAGYVLQWDIKQASALRPMLPAVPDDLQALAVAALDRFDALAPALAGLRWQVVHNDLNPHNVLVSQDNPDQIAGILDFGDMVHTPLICDAAIAASYCVDPARPLESLLNFARAYHSALPLTLTERRLFADMVATRMLTTITVASARAKVYPDNAPYILRNMATAREGLTALAALPRLDLLNALEAL
ncbi:aminotransferase [Cypionkella aquatica]|uniref:Hydroxylysine kinase n=1 Tax=Cypionkella aquatica TaxID=1756042 RepID=A0AA37TSF1_9RHOB|nr:phosphotransferase [Cypionkella aquatica]GLS86578.1 aminotransferase [Cypionkella aquatica]